MPLIKSSQSSTREEWLTKLAKLVEPLFRGFTFPKYRITCGWPSVGALGKKSVRLGECHSSKSSKDGTFELFISPLLDKPLEVAGTVVHEMAHIIAGTEAGHGKEFISVCRHVGLTAGKPTNAMPGPDLNNDVSKLLLKLGNYPHTAMAPALVVKIKQSSVTRLQCECGCSVVIPNKWLESVGAPTCGCGGSLQ